MLRHASSALRRGISFLLLFMFILTLGSVSNIDPLSAPAVMAAEWKGEEVKQDGVLHVKNPSEAMLEPVSFELEELWRLGGETDDEDEFFGVISRILIDENGTLYALDSQLSEIKVYAPDGSYLRTIGREGEGPGEFRRPADMFFLPSGDIAVLQTFPGRIITVTRDGEPGEDHPLPTAGEGGFVLLYGGGGSTANGVVLSIGINKFDQGTGVFNQERAIVLVDAEGNRGSTFHTEERRIEMSNAVFDEKVWNTFDRVWNVGPDGRVYANVGYNDYAINVWNGDGTADRVIERVFEPRRRSAEEREYWDRVYNEFTGQQVPNSSWTVSEYDKDYQGLYPREDGTIWVLNARGQIDRADGTLGTFDVFDPDGHFVQQVTLVGEGDADNDAYFFVKDRLFVVTGMLQAAVAAQGGSLTDDEDEEPEPMAILCYQLDGLKVGLR